MKNVTPGQLAIFFMFSGNFSVNVSAVLSQLLDVTYDPEPGLFLLSDDSSVALTLNQKRIFFSGLTAAKKTIISSWFPPNSLSKQQ